MKRLVVTILVIFASVLPATLVWLLIAHPAEWTSNGDGLSLGEQAASAQFAVTGWFAVIGLVVGLLSGVWFDRRQPDAGWTGVLLLVAAVFIAAVLTSSLGYLFGPPDPASLAAVSKGTKVPEQFIVEGISPYLVWPAAAAIGAFASLMNRASQSAPQSPQSDPVA